MHCDWANISIPETCERDVLKSITPILHAVGAVAITDEVWKIASGGTFKRNVRNDFSVYGCSGVFLSELRSSGFFTDFFSEFIGVPHRVTKMDIAHDVSAYSPPILNDIYSRAVAGGVSLTRKKIRPNQVRKLFSPGHDGVDTGTVYLGNRTSEVHCKIYDKAHERYCAGAVESFGDPLTRYELSFTSKAGATLDDIFSPEGAFWHYMSDVLTPPDPKPEWVKRAEGYALPKKKVLLPAELLKRKIEFHPEFDSLLRLAHECGPNGFNYLVRLLGTRYDSLVEAGADADADADAKVISL